MTGRVRLWFMPLLFIMVISSCRGDNTISSAKAITAFLFTNPAAAGAIDENAKTVAVTVPNGTNVTALIAWFSTTGASVHVAGTRQVSGTTTNDFTNPVAYTVTAADGSTTVYTVTVTVTPAAGSAKTITAYSFTNPTALGVINESAKTIDVALPFGSNVTALVALFSTTGASVKVAGIEQVSGTTANNFTSPVMYSVTAVDSTSATYLVTVTVAASTAANAIKLASTGQTVCYNSAGVAIACANTGQNGALQNGVAWPNPRFSANADTSFSDNLTGIVWAPNGNLMLARDSGWDADATPNDGRVTWQHALDYVAKLNAENYLGHKDWRLPNRKELRSLANYQQSSIETWLNTQGFASTQAYGYWSSTSYTNHPGYAWFVNMFDGHVNNNDKAFTYYVWPVREGQ